MGFSYRLIQWDAACLDSHVCSFGRDLVGSGLGGLTWGPIVFSMVVISNQVFYIVTLDTEGENFSKQRRNCLAF